MRNRLFVLLIAGISLAVLGVSPLILSTAKSAAKARGKMVGNFALKDTSGRDVSLASFRDKKAIVVIFIGTECPINNQFMPRLAELHKKYSPQGVQFLGINSNRQDTTQRIAEHAKQYAIPFPILKDDANRVADQFGAQRTPEAFVLDAEARILYQGRIDDQFGSLYKRPEPTRRDLAIALDEVLAGKPVTEQSTPVAGCLISRVIQGRVIQAKAEAPITYTKQVARILQNHCQECHRPGSIAPMPLLTFDDASDWAETIREVVQERRMPPWFADPHFGKFSNDRSLPNEDRETLLAWIEQGCPKGDDQDLPPPKEFVEGWAIGKPDVILTMKDEFEVPATAPKTGIPYKYFEIETNFKEDRWIERAQAKEGARSVVHLAELFVLADKAGLLRDPELAVERMRRVLAVAGIVEEGSYETVH